VIETNAMNIKELREKKNLTQEELSAKTGIPRTRIAKWEQGKGAPKAKDYELLVKFFGEEVPVSNKDGDSLSRRDLEQTLKNMSEDKLHSTEIIKMLAEDKLRNTAIFEKLAALLENQFSSIQSSKSPLEPGLKDKLVGTPSPKQDLSLDKKYSQEGRGAKRHR
jgi:transcriptional regulator with XRE-family HTH domain